MLACSILLPYAANPINPTGHTAYVSLLPVAFSVPCWVDVVALCVQAAPAPHLACTLYGNLPLARRPAPPPTDHATLQRLLKAEGDLALANAKVRRAWVQRQCMTLDTAREPRPVLWQTCMAHVGSTI